MAKESPYRAVDPDAPSPIVVTTGPDVPGFRVLKVIAVVHGVAMRPMRAPLAVTRAARDAAAARLLDEARGLGANAIVGMRYDSSTEEICAYGTAVRIGPA
jgi:uncharacterized protein YbjQ (UPF0145 family)